MSNKRKILLNKLYKFVNFDCVFKKNYFYYVLKIREYTFTNKIFTVPKYSGFIITRNTQYIIFGI